MELFSRWLKHCPDGNHGESHGVPLYPKQQGSQSVPDPQVHKTESERLPKQKSSKKVRRQSIKAQKKVTSVLKICLSLSEETTTVMEDGDREKDKMEKAVTELTQENKRLKDENSTLQSQVAKLERQLDEKNLIIMKIKTLTH